VEVFDRVEAARFEIVGRHMQVRLVCVASRSFVAWLREWYYGRVITRVDAVKLSALSQRIEARIAPKDTWNDRYGCDAANVSNFR
jgi:hypothetical protein